MQGWKFRFYLSHDLNLYYCLPDKSDSDIMFCLQDRINTLRYIHLRKLKWCVEVNVLLNNSWLAGQCMYI